MQISLSAVDARRQFAAYARTCTTDELQVAADAQAFLLQLGDRNSDEWAQLRLQMIRAELTLRAAAAVLHSNAAVRSRLRAPVRHSPMEVAQ